MYSSHAERLKEFCSTPEYKLAAIESAKMFNLSLKIYGRRKDLGLTQKELAKRASTTQRIVSELEWAYYEPKNGIGDDLYSRLAEALEIDRDYLFSEKYDRFTYELFVYLGEKLKWKLDIMQFMKIPYFIDVALVQGNYSQLTNFQYYRYEFGPFDKKVYAYKALFEGKKFHSKYKLIDHVLPEIDKILSNLPIHEGEKLKKLSYETAPMKALGAKMGNKKGWNELLDLGAR